MNSHGFIKAMNGMGWSCINYVTNPIRVMHLRRYATNLYLCELPSGRSVSIFDSSIQCSTDSFEELMFLVSSTFYEDYQDTLERELFHAPYDEDYYNEDPCYEPELADMY